MNTRQSIQNINTSRSIREKNMATLIRIGTGGDNQEHVSTPMSVKNKIKYRGTDLRNKIQIQNLEQDKLSLGSQSY